MTESKPLWGGRFSDGTDAFLQEFGASLPFDITLLDQDIRGSIAWAEALGQAGVLDSDEVARILAGLHKVHAELRATIESGAKLDPALEDVHMAVETRLTALIGDTGAKLHTGRSRNDQVAVDERLYFRDILTIVDADIRQLEETLIRRAEEHIDDVLPAYTHLQQALPVRLGHYLMAWVWMLDRDRSRFSDALRRADRMPLASGAVAGSGFPIDRDFLAGRLGFAAPTENSIDAVTDRDYLIEALSAMSILMMHLSRLAEDLILWSTAEFGFVTLPDRYSTGSSMMPQKKNPDSLELVRGKTGRVYGSLMTLLTVMKGLPSAYNKDMQEDKEPFFDAVASIRGCLAIMTGVVDGIRFNTVRMTAAIDSGVYATDIADYLTRKGLPFRQAHEVVGRIVKYASGKQLSTVTLDEYRSFSPLFRDDVHTLFDPMAATDRRGLPGGTGRESVLAQIVEAHARLKRAGGSHD